MLRDTLRNITSVQKILFEDFLNSGQVPFVPPLYFPTTFQQQDLPPAPPWSACEREGASQGACAISKVERNMER